MAQWQVVKISATFIYLFFLGGVGGEVHLSYVACGILVSQPGTELVPLAVKVQSPKHWTARELPV